MPKKINLPSDLLIILIWNILTVIFIFTPFLSETIFRTILGIPMVLFLPGYALIAALFPKKGDLDGIERIALSFGLSIAVVPLLGLLLNFSFGIRLIPILVTLCIYTTILIFTAAYRRDKLPSDERFTVPFHRFHEIIEEEFNTPKSKTDRILTVILILSIALAIGMLYFVITTPKIGERFTEFYILGPEGKAENYPTILRNNSPSDILVGVVNHEYVNVNYTVRIALDKEILTDTWFSSGHNQTWEKNLTFVPDKEGTDMKLEFLLYKEDNFTAPYRDLHLWVNVTK
ncbi:MAG TPA: DUF1616 domain-containing protein [Candidatus Methanoperedens sp.]